MNQAMPIRPLLISNGLHPRYGGPPHVVVETACQLKRQGLQPEIASLCMDGEQTATMAAWPELKTTGVPVHLFKQQVPSMIGWSPEFNAFCKTTMRRFDVVHIHCLWTHCGSYAAKLARNAKVPYIVASHGMLDRWSMARSSWKKWLAMKFMGMEDMLRKADGIQFGTDDEALEARTLHLGAPEFIVPNGFNPSEFSDVRERDSAELAARASSLSGCFPVLLYLGRVHRKKGLHLLVEAFSRVVPENPKAGLLILGIPQDGEYEAELRERCQRPDLNGRVVMITDVIGRQALLAANLAHVFVLPSFQEGFSIAITEALALGLPVLATTPCHMSAVESAGAGKIVPPTVEDIASGLRWICSKSHSELSEMGTRGQHLAETNFTWSAVGLRVEAMYRKLCEGRSTGDT